MLDRDDGAPPGRVPVDTAPRGPAPGAGRRDDHGGGKPASGEKTPGLPGRDPRRLLADLLICENTVARLPFRLRVIWLVTALGIVALLAVAALLVGPAESGAEHALAATPLRKNPQADQEGPDARRRPRAAREAYSLCVERAAEGANDADGPSSAAC